MFETKRWAMALLLCASTAHAGDALEWSGFALLRASTANPGAPFYTDERTSSQLQIGLDWRPSMRFGAHLHLLGRDDPQGSRRGSVGIPQAYVEANLERNDHRLRVLGGAFFLPGSRENIDALWESPYTITPSALNSWMGEEFRPIGIDLSYTLRRSLSAGATVYRGNDTLGAFPIARGWALRDHWAVLGERLPVDEKDFASVSAETDHRLGWAARGRWNSQNAAAQITYIDNRSDARRHGELLNWDTQFTIAGGEYTRNDWTLAGEVGWGTTAVMPGSRRFSSPLRASYVLASRRLGRSRASIRAEEFDNGKSQDYSLGGAIFWTLIQRVRAGVEILTSGDEQRVLVELRYYFSGR